jgi:hypothetical protein
MKKALTNPTFLGLAVLAMIFIALHLTHFTDLNFRR